MKLLKKGGIMNLHVTTIYAFLLLTSIQLIPATPISRSDYTFNLDAASNYAISMPTLAPGWTSTKSKKQDFLHTSNLSPDAPFSNIDIIFRKKSKSAVPVPKSLVLALQNDNVNLLKQLIQEDIINVNNMYKFRNTTLAQRLLGNQIIHVTPDLILSPLDAAIAANAKQCKLVIATAVNKSATF